MHITALLRRSSIVKLLATILASLTFTALFTPTQAYADTHDTPVIIIGFSGIRWDDISQDTTPHLKAFAEKNVAANLSVHTYGETTCPAQGWLTLNTGVRMHANERTCTTLEAVHGKRIANWDSVLAQNNAKTNTYPYRYGTLARTVTPATALAMGDGAALSLAEKNGEIHGTYAPLEADVSPEVLAAQYREKAHGKRLIVIDLGKVSYEPERRLPQPLFPATMPVSESARTRIATIDAQFGALMDVIDASTPHAHIFVASVGDSQNNLAQLGFFAARNMTFTGVTQPSLALSHSTRERGLIQLTDITPTVMSLLALRTEAPYMAGAPITDSQIFAHDDSLNTLVGDQVRSRVTRALSTPFYVLLFLLFSVTLVWGVRLLYREHTGTPIPADTRLRIVRLALFTACLPAVSVIVNLIPWWNASRPIAALVASLVAITSLCVLVMTRPSLLRIAGGPMFVLGLLSFLPLAIDVLSPHHISYSLQLASLLGMQPQVGARFFGFSNATFAIFATGLLLCTAFFADYFMSLGKKKSANAVLVGAALVGVVLDGSAYFGSDFGGPPALTLGMGLMFVIMNGKRIRLVPIIILAGMAGLVSLFFAFLDYLRPPVFQSHLGRFIQSLFDGRAGTIVERKLSAAFFGLPFPLALVLSLLCVGVIAVCLVWVRRKLRSAERGERELPWLWIRIRTSGVLGLQTSIVGVSSTLVVATFINDSSFVIPAVGASIAVMVWLVCLILWSDTTSRADKDVSVRAAV